MIITKKVAGEVDLNNGEFAEVQTIGVEGIEKNLWLDTFLDSRETLQYEANRKKSEFE